VVSQSGAAELGREPVHFLGLNVVIVVGFGAGRPCLATTPQGTVQSTGAVADG
jgi:hypothetical protein